jgi:hypothetical protein
VPCLGLKKEGGKKSEGCCCTQAPLATNQPTGAHQTSAEESEHYGTESANASWQSQAGQCLDHSQSKFVIEASVKILPEIPPSPLSPVVVDTPLGADIEGKEQQGEADGSEHVSMYKEEHRSLSVHRAMCKSQ